MAPPTAPIMGAYHGALSASQQRSMQKHDGRQSRRENARWFRKRLMKVATLGQGLESGMHVQSVQVDGHEEHDGITYFRIRVKGGDGKEWHVHHRYSDFEKLRKGLGVRDKRVGSIFPQKHWFSSCKGQQIEQRQQVLQIWLAGLISEFSFGGDGRHKLLPVFRASGLVKLHSFCGVDGIGRLLPYATLDHWVFLPSAPPLSVEAVEEEDAAPVAMSDVTAQGPQITWLVLGEDPTARSHRVNREAAQEGATVGTEDEQLRAALDESVATHALEEESRRARDAEKVEAACRAEELLLRCWGPEVLARQKAQEEEAACRAEEPLLRQTEEEAEAERVALEALAKQRAEAEEAELQVEEARRKAKDDARRKAEEEEKAEEDDALLKAGEEAARSKAEEEEGLRRQAETEANKSYVEQAMNMAGAGKELEDQGQTEDASDCYKKSIALFTLALRKEKAPKVRDAIQGKIEDLTTRSTQLSEAVMAAELAQVAKIMGDPSQDSSLLGRVDALLACAPETEAARVAPLPALAPAASAAVPQ